MFGFIGKRVKKTGHTFARWADVASVKKLFGFSSSIYSTILKPEEVKAEPETFDQAVKRLKLTPEQLEERKKNFKTQILIYTVGALAVGAYTVYLIVHTYWISVLPSLAVTLFLIAHALKSHFWLFQIKHRKLGCSVQEWFKTSIKELK